MWIATITFCFQSFRSDRADRALNQIQYLNLLNVIIGKYGDIVKLIHQLGLWRDCAIVFSISQAICF